MTAADYSDFNEATSPATWNNYQRDFSVGNLTYDANGNMLSMQQHGYDASMAPALIDDLSYSYDGNQLMTVTDDGVDSPIDDFDNSNSSSSSYEYDADGNLTSDALKNLTLAYNHQDLPTEVTHGSDNIQNIYTADGTLLQKTIHEGTNTTIWHYWGPLVFRNDSLLYMLHSEGRANYDVANDVFKYDYFVKDHLGNVRTVVTSDYEPMSHEYLGTHEIASANIENAIFENLGEVRDTKPDGTPNDVECERLNGAEEERRIGAALLLRVMTGDQIDVSVYGYHGEKENEEQVSGEDMFGSLIGVLTQGAGGFNGGAEDNGTDIVNSLFEGDVLSAYENIKEGSVDPDVPRGFLNYMVFDEEFNLVGNASGAEQLDADIDSWEQISVTANIETNGYVLIYLSSEDETDVFFDNLNILHHNGRLLEEQHYYPHGLLIKHLAGNTGMARNRYQYQGNEMQPELGMQLYDFHARQYDPQIGRFLAIDPLADFGGQESLSPYHFSYNNPANFVDPLGLGPLDVLSRLFGRRDNPYACYNKTMSDGSSGGGIWEEIEKWLEGILGDGDSGGEGSGGGGKASNTGSNVSSSNGSAASYGASSGTVIRTSIPIHGGQPRTNGGGNGTGNTKKGNGHYPVVTGKTYQPRAKEKRATEQAYANATKARQEEGRASSNSKNGLTAFGDYYGYATFVPSLALSIASTKFGKTMANGGVLVKNLTDAAKSELAFTGRMIKNTSNSLGYLGLGISGIDIWANGINWSNGADATSGAASFIPGVGWVIGAVYWGINESSKANTGRTFGENIEYAIWLRNFLKGGTKK